MSERAAARPNVLLVVTDQERARAWVPDDLWEGLTQRRRLRDAGMELRGHYTHSSPCSPSRATLLTGQHLPEHGVTDNVFVDPVQPDLHSGTPTIGHRFRDAGYRTAYLGKWHLSYGNPDMEAYGFSDWVGEDWAWTGLAGTGTYYDEVIAAQAASWLGAHGTDGPWLLVVGFVNPHDVAWYPADQPDYQAANPDRVAEHSRLLPTPIPGRPPIATYDEEYAERFELPANFYDDLTSKPAVQHAWRWEENHSMFGWLDLHDTRVWRRCLDYYWRLHELNDVHVGTVLDALVASGAWDDTIVVLTSDHGEQAGSHGFRGKGPFAYEEIMHVPLVVRAPGVTAPGSSTRALTSSVDLAPTLCALAGIDTSADRRETMSGLDLSPLLRGDVMQVRDHVLFAQAQGWHQSCLAQRYALRGYFDGRHKYVRYYGVGGGCDNVGRRLDWAPEMRFGPDAEFGDHEHELYDLDEDPGELRNLAHDAERRGELEDRFAHLLELERAAFIRRRPEGPSRGSTHEAPMMERSGWFT